jgi:hypothetical protein
MPAPMLRQVDRTGAWGTRSHSSTAQSQDSRGRRKLGCCRAHNADRRGVFPEWLSRIDRFGPSVVGPAELATCRRAVLRHHFRRLLVWRFKERNKARYERHLAALEQNLSCPEHGIRRSNARLDVAGVPKLPGPSGFGSAVGRTCRASRGRQSNRASSGAYVATTFGIGRVTLGS